MKKLFFIFSLLFSMNSYSQYIDGNDLHKRINNTTIADELFAWGYIIGVVDSRFKQCNWNNVKIQQIVDSVKIHLNNNPNQRQLTGAIIVETVIKKDYCR